MPDQKALIEEKHFGGTMRLGAYPCHIQKDTKAFAAYGKEDISERHRHRYEVNNEYRKILQEHGMIFSGVNSERDLVEIGELKEHPFFVGTQFHPEFKSRPLNAHPLFLSFIKACIR
jgi:CTP synthase